MSMGGGDVTVGYKYFIGMHLVVCHGPVDEVLQIQVGDRVAWSGSVTSTRDVQITAEELFGGEKREGGIAGTVGFKFGDAAQTRDGYLAGSGGGRPGPNCPAFRGVMSFVLKQVYIGLNPYLKPWAFKVRRYPATGWYDANRAIGAHANPAHILFECVTHGDWGMGYPPYTLDDGKFRTAADTLYAEGFGLSLLWNQQSSVKDFMQQVLDHIGGVFRLNPSTGLFELKLIRDDYDPATLPELNESNVVSLDSYQRTAWGETVNEIVCRYTKPDGREVSITVHDLGNIQIQGGVVSETVTYTGIHDDSLAKRVAMRDLRARSAPLSKVRLTLNRQG